MESLPLIFEAFQCNPDLETIFWADENGSFFAVQKLSSPMLRTYYSAPENAAYALESHDKKDPRTGNRIIHYDTQENIISEIPRQNRAPYDPRQRPWYIKAMRSSEAIRTLSYISSTTGQFIQTIARRTADSRSVMAVNFPDQSVDTLIESYKPYPTAVVVFFNDKKHIVNDSRKAFAPHPETKGTISIPTIDETDDPLIDMIEDKLAAKDLNKTFTTVVGNQEWFAYINELSNIDDTQFYLATMVPVNDILVNARREAASNGYLTTLVLLLSVPITWFFARRISRDLARLSSTAQNIRFFDFTADTKVSSNIKEIRELSADLDYTRRTIRSFLKINAVLTSEQNLHRLLRITLKETMRAIQAQTGIIYLISEDGELLVPEALMNVSHIRDKDGNMTQEDQNSDHSMLEPIVITDQNNSQIARTVFSKASLVSRISRDDIPPHSLCQIPDDADRIQLITTPLKNSDDTIVGVLCLYRLAELQPPDMAMLSFIEKLSSGAAVSIEKHRLLQEQKNLIDSMITLLAKAIDAKSPYTGGHCQRVPVITKLFAEEVHITTTGPFADFHLGTDGWEALRIAAWLHDCGKVTTPEHVVDKATKLETVHNRIHEIRTRFEVLKRDREIACLKAITNGEDEEQARSKLAEEQQSLDDEFRFVAECNLGTEMLSSDSLGRLEEIASRTWMRTLSNRLGISWEESSRMEYSPEQPLPVEEKLLDDKPEHLIPRTSNDMPPEENAWKFKLQVPTYRYNLGELFNLSIKRGTLTEEERYKVNDHIVQTIVLLSHMPFPRHLRQVPEIAGGHHERIDSKGYPKGLHKNDMSVEARIVAIADVFEALTARDRPYKKSKTLSDSLNIMASVVRDGHLDRDLFEIFVEREVYAQYAEKYLLPAQIDPVDKKAILRKCRSLTEEHQIS